MANDNIKASVAQSGAVRVERVQPFMLPKPVPATPKN
jgi:hypothetical protein